MQPDDTDRSPPRRYIDKKEGARHVIHAAIRGTFAGEDPFAIHLLSQSAEKVLLDMLKAAGKPDPLFSLLKPGMENVFFGTYRESYNFLKHADKDADGKLGVRDIVGANDLSLFMCSQRYGLLFDELTVHMRSFSIFAALLFPTILSWEQFPPSVRNNLKLATHNVTRGALAANMLAGMQQDQAFLLERQQDLAEAIRANAIAVKQVR